MPRPGEVRARGEPLFYFLASGDSGAPPEMEFILPPFDPTVYPSPLPTLEATASVIYRYDFAEKKEMTDETAETREAVDDIALLL